MNPPTDQGLPTFEDPTAVRRRAVRVLMVAALVMLLLGAGAVGLLLERQRAYDRNIERISGVFPSEAGRPSPAPQASSDAVTLAEDWLLVGSDRRADQATTGGDAGEPLWRFGQQRADTLMLVHVPADRSGVYLVSFPRDLWVPIQGHGRAKINAALSFGGPPLLIATMEQLTGVRIDHFAMLDFRGFESITDAVGGVEVEVAEDVSDPMNDVAWQAGTQHLDGAQALKFVRQRYNLPGGDFDRIKRQQAFLKALAGRVSDGDVLANPLRLNALLEAATSAVSVDDAVKGSDLRSLAVQLRSVRADDIVSMTVPTAGLGTENGQSVVYIARGPSRRLFRALRNDTVDRYVAGNDDAVNQVDEVR